MAKKTVNELGRLRFREVSPGHWATYREGQGMPKIEPVQKEAVNEPQTTEGEGEAPATKRGRKKAADA